MATKVTLTKATADYLNLREQSEKLEAQLSQAEANFKLALAQDKVTFSVFNGIKVALISAERAKYSVVALKELVSDKLFKTVTKLDVDGKKFKSAVELGVITAEVAEAVTTMTPYTQIRVTELADQNAEVASTTKSQVA